MLPLCGKWGLMGWHGGHPDMSLYREGGTTHIAQEVGKSWHSPLLLYWVVVSNIIGEAKPFICLPETNMFPQVHTWSKTRMTWHTCCFIPISTSMYGDLLWSAFLRLILVVTNILFHKNFSSNMSFSYELMLHVWLFNLSEKGRSSEGPQKKKNIATTPRIGYKRTNNSPPWHSLTIFHSCCIPVTPSINKCAVFSSTQVDWANMWGACPSRNTVWLQILTRTNVPQVDSLNSIDELIIVYVSCHFNPVVFFLLSFFFNSIDFIRYFWGVNNEHTSPDFVAYLFRLVHDFGSKDRGWRKNAKDPIKIIDLKFNSNPPWKVTGPKRKGLSSWRHPFSEASRETSGVFYPPKSQDFFLVSLCNVHIFSLSSGLNFSVARDSSEKT